MWDCELLSNARRGLVRWIIMVSFNDGAECLQRRFDIFNPVGQIIHAMVKEGVDVSLVSKTLHTWEWLLVKVVVFDFVFILQIGVAIRGGRFHTMKFSVKISVGAEASLSGIWVRSYFQ